MKQEVVDPTLSEIPLFKSFFMAGFECSTHLLPNGKRMDFVALTGHDAHAEADYARLAEYGISAARDGIRWHLIEQTSGRYDFSSALPVIHAARKAGTQVVWDLCHYGWPDHLDIFSADFITHFAGLAREFTMLLRNETDETPFITPVNETTFFSWIAGEKGKFAPCTNGREQELKEQLVRASIAAIEAVWSVDSKARIVLVDPLLHVVSDPRGVNPRIVEALAELKLVQYQAWDMLGGYAKPALGGDPKYLDIIGVNYYPWVYGVAPIDHLDAQYLDHYSPLSQLLQEMYERYNRPIIIAETGQNGDHRPDWLRYVCDEVRKARELAVPVEALCIYPFITTIWPYGVTDSGASIECGLWGPADESGRRSVFSPLVRELSYQQRLFDSGA